MTRKNVILPFLEGWPWRWDSVTRSVCTTCLLMNWVSSICYNQIFGGTDSANIEYRVILHQSVSRVCFIKMSPMCPMLTLCRYVGCFWAYPLVPDLCGSPPPGHLKLLSWADVWVSVLEGFESLSTHGISNSLLRYSKCRHLMYFWCPKASETEICTGLTELIWCSCLEGMLWSGSWR